MKRLSPALFLLSLFFVFSSGCAGCADFGDDDVRDNPYGEFDPFDHDADASPSDDTGSNALDANSDDGDADQQTSDAGEDDAGIDDAGGEDAGEGDAADSGECGDGHVDPNEACDDGNTDDEDYCASDCMTVTGACGDGVVQGSEACDDANTDAGDYCSSDCQTTTGACGDGVLQANETCDDGSTARCDTDHDGGDGTCVPAGQCASGYVLDGSGNCVQNPTGLSEPCSNGSGYTLFRFHYSSNSSSAQIDVWDATCSYSFAPNSACNVREVYPGFGDVSRTSENYPIFTSSEYLRVRFSVNGLNFTNATLWIQARSYATSSSTYYDVWSPLYGEKEGGPVDNDFVYDWYALDWTGYLYPSDDPSYTAIQIYGGRGSGSLAVRAVEMCVE